MDKQEIIEILNDWNFWEDGKINLYNRKYYDKQLQLFDKTDEITIIKGIRRCGKSSLLINHIKYLISKNIDQKQILYINFEDPRFIGNLNVKLLDEIYNTYLEYINNGKKAYVFLDEIQEIPMWEKWVRTKYELKQLSKIYITGSSSKLLSYEFGTALSGRYIDLEMYPLSFKEYIIFKNETLPNKLELTTQKIKYKKLFNDYFEEGGFPKIILSEKELQKKEIITYFDSIILKDIVARYNLKNSENVKKVAQYLITNIGKPISLNSIKTSLNISYDLVENYYQYLKESYLILELKKYDESLKKQFSSQNKIYAIDLSFNINLGFKFSEDMGRLLENLVFIELKKQNKEIYYHKDKHECDFVIKEGLNIISAIQVTKSLSDLDTKKRELNGLIEACEKYKLKKGLILTQDEEFVEIVHEGIEIKVMPIWKWLLDNPKGY